MNEVEHFEELEALLDTVGFVSVANFANRATQTVVVARNIMKKYKDSHSDVGGYFVLSGRRKGSTDLRSFSIVHESDIENESKKFDKIASTKLFSLQRIGGRESFATQVYFSDLDQISELMTKKPQFDHLVLNKVGGISCPALTVAPVGKRQLSAASSSPRASPSTETASEQISRVFSNSTVKVVAKPSVAVTSFFGRANSEDAKPKAAAVTKKPADAAPKTAASRAPATASASTSASSTAPLESTPAVVKPESLDEDAEWDDGTGYKPDKKKVLKKWEEEQRLESRKRFATLKSDDVPEAEDGAGDEVVDISEEASGETSKGGKKQKGPVHGAMDNYFEDVAIAAELERQELAKSSSEGAPVEIVKKKKRKLIEQVVADERGYLVTQNVWVELSEDEADTPVPAPAPASRAPSSSAPAAKKATPAPAKKAAGPPAGQKGMMSFFAKK